MSRALSAVRIANQGKSSMKILADCTSLPQKRWIRTTMPLREGPVKQGLVGSSFVTDEPSHSKRLILERGLASPLANAEVATLVSAFPANITGAGNHADEITFQS